jgi:xylulokinase
MLCLGLDSGTTNCKGLVLDTDAGNVLAWASAPHSFVAGLPRSHVEQDPQNWSDAAERVILTCLEKIGERRSELVAFGVSAQQHGLVTLDDRNQPVRPAKLWCDTSTAGEAEKLNRAFGTADTLIERTSNAMVSGYTAPKILWLKENEPKNFEATRTILLPHDFLNFWLTGERQMEYGDASGTGLLDIRSRTWCKPLAEFIDKSVLTKFPPLRSSTRPVGLLRSPLREKFQVGDILVSAGGGDNMLGAIGTANLSPGRLTISLGTSGTIYTFVETPVVDPRGELSAFCDSTDHWLSLACTMNVANAVEQIRDLFGWETQALERNVARSEPGANGLMFLSYFYGERLPNLPNGVAVIHGLNSSNTTRHDIARALIEGIVIGLAQGMNRLTGLGIEVKELRITGGGAKSASMRQIVADIFGLPVIGFKVVEGAALGAAIQAAWTYCQTTGEPLQLDKIVKSAVRTDRKTRAEPRKENQALYADLRGRHADLTRKLAGSGYL